MVGLSLAVSAILVFLNGVFVGYEFAILRSNVYHLETLATGGHQGAALALRQRDRVNEYLAVCQLGITAVTLALTVAFQPTVSATIGPILNTFLSEGVAQGVNIGLALFIATSVHVTFGELIPKSLALISPESLASRVARLIEFLYRLFRPAIWLFNGISTYLARLATGRPVRVEPEELVVHEALRHSYRSGMIDESQFELLDAVLEFPDRMVREVMTPRSNLIYINPEQPIDEILHHVTEHYYTRYPVIADGVVEGYVLIHDLFSEPDPRAIDWKKLIRPMPKIPETLTLPRLHEAMGDAPLAAVFDEYNEFVGIITHADVDEEIMGELLEEDDEPPLPLIQTDDDGSYIINATESVDDVMEALGISVDEEELDGIDSFGGLLLTHLGREPNEGDEVTWGGYRFVVEETDRFRITRVRAWVIEPDETDLLSDSSEDGDEL